MNSDDTTKRMDRVLSAVRQSAEVISDLTPSQLALARQLGFTQAELWLGVLALLLPAGENERNADPPSSGERRQEGTRNDDD